MSNWRDDEIRALLAVRADTEIVRQIQGTARDSVVYDQITTRLRERGVIRAKAQVNNKLKALKRQYYQVVEDNGRSENAPITWCYFNMCEAIWGPGHSMDPVAVVGSLDTASTSRSPETLFISSFNETAYSDTEDKSQVHDTPIPISDSVLRTESPVSPQTPPNKSAKKVSRGEQMVKDMKEFFTEMDRDFEERERLRLLEQRQYEECLRKEAKEEEREERARQMAMFKELLESQNNLLRELLRRIPSPTSQQPTPSKNSGKPETTSSVANIPETRECTKSVPSSHAESYQSPPNKRAKKVSQEEQIAKDMKECFAEIARTLEERERLRLLEQRQHEEHLKKEAKEEAREERARQMTMFKEMQEAQNHLLKELLRRMPSPTLQQFNSFKYWHSGNQSKFNTDTAGNSNIQNTSEQDMIFNPPSSTFFME